MKPDAIKQRLESAFPGDKVEVTDLTGTADHYEVIIESDQFKGLTRIKQHQKVMAVFAPELKTGEVHALSIQTKVKN